MIFQGGHFGGSRPGDQILSDTPVGQTLRKKGKVSILYYILPFLWGISFVKMKWRLSETLPRRGWQGGSLFKIILRAAMKMKWFLSGTLPPGSEQEVPRDFFCFLLSHQLPFSLLTNKNLSNTNDQIFLLCLIQISTKKRRRIVSTGVL